MNIPDGDHVLTEGAAWFTLGKASIRIYKTDERVTIDVFRNGKEMDEVVASTYWFDDELEEIE